MHHIDGISGPNAFYLCSQRDSEDKSASSPGDCRKTDIMLMHIRMHILFGTNLLKLCQKQNR